MREYDSGRASKVLEVAGGLEWYEVVVAYVPTTHRIG
jgi:hypothetical protein